MIRVTPLHFGAFNEVLMLHGDVDTFGVVGIGAEMVLIQLCVKNGVEEVIV